MPRLAAPLTETIRSMVLCFRPLRPTFASAIFAAALFAGATLAARADPASRVERLEQGLASFGRRLDVTQLFDRPPADIDDEAPDPARDAGGASVRLDRLENQMRSLNGRIEELQHDIRRLDELLRKPAQDALGAPAPLQRRGEAEGPAAQVAAPTAAAGAEPGAAVRRGDAFDPARDPNAAGAPRPLGATAPSAPLANPPAQTRLPGPSAVGAGPAPATSDLRTPGAPLDLTHGRLGEDPARPAPASPGPAPTAAAPPPAAPQTAKDDYDLALSYLHQGQYESAEKGFSAFLAKNPKSRLAPQATFNLGESFFLRGRHREAAEKYLEISTRYATSPQAPEAMLRLGQSLHALGAKEQACASFGELAVKYPSAAARIKDAAARERKKDQC